jgi:L-threonylcarbamoyladenylate synthase
MSNATPGEIKRAVEILRAGGLVAFATETVYGLGADATNVQAVAKIFAAKGRPSGNPLIVHVADVELARKYSAGWQELAEVLASKFWPGPLTLVLPRGEKIVSAVTAGLKTMAVRCPDHPLALNLLKEFAGPIAAPSANRSNRISPTTAEHVRRDLGDKVDLILDGGPSRVGIESTVLSLASPVPTILRLGAVTREEIEALIGHVEVQMGLSEGSQAASSPGQQAVHYSPVTSTFRFDEGDMDWVRKILKERLGRRKIFLIIAGSELARELRGRLEPGEILEMPSQPDEYARSLYASLHRADQSGVEMIWVQKPPEELGWEAIADRVMRATRPASEAV